MRLLDLKCFVSFDLWLVFILFGTFIREELEKQRAAQHYQKLHAEGKTEEARSDLARLAIVKQQREEAAKKRELEKKGTFCCALMKTSKSMVYSYLLS